MRYFFSKAKNGFYTDEWHPNRPDDCVEITAEKHQELLQEQVKNGKEIVGDENGCPIAVERVYDAQSLAKQQATLQLKNTDYLIVKYWEAESPVPPEWREYREALREVVRGNRTELPVKPQ